MELISFCGLLSVLHVTLQEQEDGMETDGPVIAACNRGLFQYVVASGCSLLILSISILVLCRAPVDSPRA